MTNGTMTRRQVATALHSTECLLDIAVQRIEDARGHLRDLFDAGHEHASWALDLQDASARLFVVVAEVRDEIRRNARAQGH